MEIPLLRYGNTLPSVCIFCCSHKPYLGIWIHFELSSVCWKRNNTNLEANYIIKTTARSLFRVNLRPLYILLINCSLIITCLFNDNDVNNSTQISLVLVLLLLDIVPIYFLVVVIEILQPSKEKPLANVTLRVKIE